MRLIDTARIYNIEEQVGKGIKSGISREDIFVGTKLWCNDYHPKDVERAVDDPLRDLDTPYVDLLLMYYPCTFKRGADRFPRDAEGRVIRAMEDVIKSGKVKAIGVSNFSKGEIETLLEKTGTVPAVHQMEVHPYLQQKEFNKWLREQGIHVVQFSPLRNMNDFYRQTGWSKEIAHMKRVIDQPIMKAIAEKYGKSTVQVALAWGINSGRSVIPKSVVGWQVEQNLESDFELQPEDMAQISILDAKARFNDPSLDYEWPLYSDSEGIDGTVKGRTH
ncbi:hypothetical protein N7527_011315 [Penicillium freii]|uniref:D-xylose reductase [NAD(P)H] n=1 Tax=Penicillium freii TaxID=48697 RepID=A0A101M823_PENFR|nr:hypothetical protein N7527_011315 [Penicillium freii]KUM55560.1 hypothetical protein ACN42_g11693 [Penicillium freii]